jgi:hypothetical protein
VRRHREVYVLIVAVGAAAVWAWQPRAAAVAGDSVPRMRVVEEYPQILRNLREGRGQFTLSLFGQPTRVTIRSVAGRHENRGHFNYELIRVQQRGAWGANDVTYELESADGIDNVLRVEIDPQGEDFYVTYPDLKLTYDSKRTRS